MAFMKLTVGVIGLGKMGQAIVYRLIKAGFQVYGFDKDKKACAKVMKYGVVIVDTVEQVSQRARIVWLMVPAGAIVDAVVKQLEPHLQKNDCIIDGGNSHFSDSLRRAEELKKKEIYFIDCGTSGGLAGKQKGFSLMLGGNREIVEQLIPVWQALAARQGYGYMGSSGTGHYIKMVHNGIEYAMLQAYAEGFHLLHQGSFSNIDLELVTRVWGHGSIIRSWILHLAHTIFKKDQKFEAISGQIQESGTGFWTVQEAQAKHIPIPLIEKALEVRAWSRATGGNYATKIVALLRHKFGGHSVTKLKKAKVRKV